MMNSITSHEQSLQLVYSLPLPKRVFEGSSVIEVILRCRSPLLQRRHGTVAVHTGHSTPTHAQTLHRPQHVIIHVHHHNTLSLTGFTLKRH